MKQNRKGRRVYLWWILVLVLCMLIGCCACRAKGREEARHGSYTDLAPQDPITINQFLQMVEDSFHIEVDGRQTQRDHFFSCIQENASPPSGDRYLTRQQFYRLLLELVRQIPDLSADCLPQKVIWEEGSESGYYQRLFNGLLVGDGEGYAETLLSLQQAEAVKMAVATYFYDSGRTERIFVWDSANRAVTRYQTFVQDWEKVRREYQEDLLLACEIGLVSVFPTEQGEGLVLHPEAYTSKQETEDAIARLLHPDLRCPPDCIRIQHEAHDEFDLDGKGSGNVLIRFPSASFVSAARILEAEMGQEDRLFFTFGTNGVSFCLWYHFAQYGMLALPLQFGEEEPVCIEIPARSRYVMETRLKLLSFLLPKKERQAFQDWALACLSEGTSLAERAFGHRTVHILSFEESVYSVYILGQGGSEE